MIVITGESASGKSTLQRDFLAKHPDWHKVVTVTTRKPRSDEVDGKDYRFVSNAKFHDMVYRGVLAEEDKYGGHWYGTPRDLCSDARALAVLTPRGALSLKASGVSVVMVYLKTDRETRMMKRLERGDGVDEAYLRDLEDNDAFHDVVSHADFVIDNTNFRLSSEQVLDQFEGIVRRVETAEKSRAYSDGHKPTTSVIGTQGIRQQQRRILKHEEMEP